MRANLIRFGLRPHNPFKVSQKVAFGFYIDTNYYCVGILISLCLTNRFRITLKEYFLWCSWTDRKLHTNHLLRINNKRKRMKLNFRSSSEANSSKQIHHHQNFNLVRDPAMVSEISKQAKSISKHPQTRMSRAIVQRWCRNSCTAWRAGFESGHVRTGADRVQESSHVVRQDAIAEKGLTPTNAPEVFRRTDFSTGIIRNPTPFTLIWYCSVHGSLVDARGVPPSLRWCRHSAAESVESALSTKSPL